ncbi:MAG: tRNA dihydrouridine synthase DusB, partial [Coxiellaceae bacterium]|nr:tRNA dihydrouridine synthase DusB [Coxiellaceae bacterium]
VGGEPAMMAEAAKYNVDQGADIIDINMGCPAKKVCHRDAGSALLKDEKLVSEILAAVVEAVEVPVTLKIRTGWDRATKNGLTIAKMAEDLGIQALAVHGRTRADKYEGEAEYETIAAIKSSVNIPIIANGDINSPEKAKRVLEKTKADAVMLGRIAQGRPWVFREFTHYFKTGEHLKLPTEKEISEMMLTHVNNLYDFYGEYQGLRIARRHVGWYLRTLKDSAEFRRHFNTLETAEAQCGAIGRLCHCER